MQSNRIIRKQPKGFTMVSNAVLLSPLLTLKAKGLYSLLDSFKDGWTFKQCHIATLSKDGKDSNRAAWAELIKYGLLTKTWEQMPGGVPVVIWTLGHELKSPKAENPKTEKPKIGFPEFGKPDTNKTNKEQDYNTTTKKEEKEKENFEVEKKNPLQNEVLVNRKDLKEKKEPADKKEKFIEAANNLFLMWTDKQKEAFVNHYTGDDLKTGGMVYEVFKTFNVASKAAAWIKGDKDREEAREQAKATKQTEGNEPDVFTKALQTMKFPTIQPPNNLLDKTNVNK